MVLRREPLLSVEDQPPLEVPDTPRATCGSFVRVYRAGHTSSPLARTLLLSDHTLTAVGELVGTPDDSPTLPASGAAPRAAPRCCSPRSPP